MLPPELTVLPPHGNHRPAYLVSDDEWHARPPISTRKEIIGSYIPVILDFSNGREKALRDTYFGTFAEPKHSISSLRGCTAKGREPKGNPEAVYTARTRVQQDRVAESANGYLGIGSFGMLLSACIKSQI